MQNCSTMIFFSLVTSFSEVKAIFLTSLYEIARNQWTLPLEVNFSIKGSHKSGGF